MQLRDHMLFWLLKVIENTGFEEAKKSSEENSWSLCGAAKAQRPPPQTHPATPFVFMSDPTLVSAMSPGAYACRS
eukprot:15571976-Heterocapsa_arctica.AAC.1